MNSALRQKWARWPLVMLSLIAAGVALGQTFKPGHKYVVGNSDRYALETRATLPEGKMVAKFLAVMTVKKVYENGDADISGVFQEGEIILDGKTVEQNSAPDAPTTTRYDHFGRALSGYSIAASGVVRFATYLGERELKAGESSNFDYPNPESAGEHTKGVVTLKSMESGKAKLLVSADDYSKGHSKPMHIEASVTVDVSTGKVLRFEGTASNVPAAEDGPQTVTFEFSMIHK